MGTHNDAVDLSLMDDVFREYEGQRGALIPILQKAQEKYGWLPPEVLNLIAKKLGIPVSKVFGVATFYAQFYLERRGRHILRLCDGTACHVRGTPILLTALEEHYQLEPGETTEDGELTVELVYCLGSCALAPVAVLDGEVLGRLRQNMLLRTLKKRIDLAKPA
ncbi:MAG: NAD(P)H-dependent oxidoreductase subunit E [Chloroflexi bacterium]|nr:NAD(P)H-dependent oxidoreductase subunit E [Chloroflexota bacterium]